MFSLSWEFEYDFEYETFLSLASKYLDSLSRKGFGKIQEKYFEDFQVGKKPVEYYRVGIMFTFDNCGREVTLSLGYGTRDRLAIEILVDRG
ncbi:MAG: hypothetical protein EBE86_010035 [Hormoscilla sp. GUM202]|nr:hypothetical protein [Hormoscilla sp. GUM202]